MIMMFVIMIMMFVIMIMMFVMMIMMFVIMIMRVVIIAHDCNGTDENDNFNNCHPRKHTQWWQGRTGLQKESWWRKKSTKNKPSRGFVSKNFF